jgi:hypothetical protein
MKLQDVMLRAMAKRITWCSCDCRAFDLISRKVSVEFQNCRALPPKNVRVDA